MVWPNVNAAPLQSLKCINLYYLRGPYACGAVEAQNFYWGILGKLQYFLQSYRKCSLMGTEVKSNRTEFAKYHEHFEQSLAPSLLSLESERKRRFMIGTISAIVLLLIALFLSWHIYGMADDMARSGRAYALAFILPIALPMSGYVFAMSNLRRKTKNHLTYNISEFLGWQHSRPKDTQSEALAKILYDFDALPKYHTVQTDDVLHGNHEHWAFGLREITLARKRFWSRSGPVVVFKGLVLSFGVERRIDGEAIITRSVRSGQPRNRPTIRHEGVIECPDGGKIMIRASNERIIKTLMCARFQRALIEFDEKNPGKDLSCVLFDNELHIPMTNKNLFEVDWLVNSMESKIRVQKMLDEFSYVLELLDVFLKPRRCDQTGVMQVPEFRYLRH